MAALCNRKHVIILFCLPTGQMFKFNLILEILYGKLLRNNVQVTNAEYTSIVIRCKPQSIQIPNGIQCIVYSKPCV